MAEVRLKNVTKIYDKNVIAVKNTNLEINDGEFIVLVGPSGCGKSTLLRMIAGLEEINEGIVEIDNRVVNDTPPKDRDIAMVFQNYALYPHMTVFDNMAFGLKLRKFSESDIKERVNETADLLGMSNFLDRKPKALSGGQRQRVALGRAIVRKPKVFLFDEPLSNLDAKLRVQMRIEITKLHQKLGTTMIYVTHDQIEAMTMGNRIVVMKDGVIQQVDTPIKIYNHPANEFVAGFIGSPAMNFMTGELIQTGVFSFGTDRFSVNLSEALSSKLAGFAGKKLILGIRPEHIKIIRKQDSETDALKAVVEVVEQMGSETNIYLKAGDISLTLRTPENVDVKVGDHVSLFFTPDKMHFFEYDSREAVI